MVRAATLKKRRNSRNARHRYFNRELSWLQFNWRVLHEALDERTPLLEKLKFLAIVSSNLDEFFMKRVGGLKRQTQAGTTTLAVDGRTPEEQLHQIRREALQMVSKQRSYLIEEVIPRLREEGLLLLDIEQLDSRDRQHVREFYEQQVFPVLTPLAVDPGHPFPFLSNLTLSLGVRLQDEGEENYHFARVKIPENVPRWVPLTQPHQWVPVEQVVAHNLSSLFPGTTILEANPFRITRNADIERNEEEADDLLDMIEEEIRHRRFASVVRLEVAEAMSDVMRQWLADSLGVQREEIYAVQGPLRLGDLFSLKVEEKPKLQYPATPGATHPMLRELDQQDSERDIFQIIREHDVLVHHPFQSFATSTLRFLEAAAADPKVLAIKQTLYRTADRSPIIAALVKAASNGKQVAVLVEIKARFDEANNIEWVRVLEEAGVHVSYGLVGLKTHTKTLLVVREEEEGIRCYCHIGTGNYHTGTARLYTDMGLLTCETSVSEDLVHLFNFLTGHSRYQQYKQFLVAPVNMRKCFLEMIEREIAHSKKGKSGRIIAKMNSLEDKEIIDKLYRASAAGVQIDLIVRGFCCLRPGVKSLSENIRVTSTIGRYLEHSRIYYFQNAGDEEYYIGSADWMYRNLDRRVECIVPVKKPIHGRLMRILQFYLNDHRQTWDAQPDGTYVQRKPENEEQEISVQERLWLEAKPR